ncbi:hypothetical protein [Hydrogenophaga sp.]|nr:hypothetical protein [Hydrogenophaga sp.]
MILEHRARLLGAHLSFDTSPDSAGWIGLKLTQNLGLNETPADRSGRPS